MRKICQVTAVSNQYHRANHFSGEPQMPVAKQSQISPAEGKLGVLLVGLGAVSTTFIAGVEAIKKGFAQPIGSLTQMGTIRLGTRERQARQRTCAACARRTDPCPASETLLDTTSLRRP